MKRRFVAVLLSLCLILAFIPVSAMAVEFDDAQGHWAEAAIDRWSDAGVVSGVGNNDFDPEGEMNRAQAAAVFSQLLQITDEADISGFTDIPEDAWYAGHIAKCVGAGIMAGMSDTIMEPETTLSREMFFTMFAQAMGIEREETSDVKFNDSAEASSWAVGYINALANRGFISGMGDGSVEPLSDINRASVMARLNQAIVTYAVEEGAQNVDGTGIVLVLADNVSITADEPITVVVAKEGATVSLAGATGGAEVIALENNVAVTDAPVGTTIAAKEGVTGTTANGQAVAPDSEITITAPTTGGGSPDPDPDPEIVRPTITVNGTEYKWDDEKEEYVSVTDPDEYLTLDELEEQEYITIDDKEYVYDADSDEWYSVGDTEEQNPVSSEEIVGGALTSEEVI
ncbi:S-layer homology domain-containing protein [Acutalibacter sp. LFL-21]|uniref:S-layer homology domain-containing protein n=1 Tax=Acutalibacter sp. LFL-21 TaxID=2983399 RepID=UPI0021D64CCF|nr:S-layer homology domain-containing protein [Acutalibacter sp. LFL-21]MCU7652507.1 S-layer homology domain-containing protein [Acutalibacter sp. LFL-21]